MSISSIPNQVKLHLWVKAGGRCQYDGCNKLLWRDSLDFSDLNNAYIAHIIADKPDGPRGDRKFSPKLAREISNLMLMCDKHHRKIDAKKNLAKYTVKYLREMKAGHEARIEMLTGIQPERKSEVLLYGANVGSQSSPVSYSSAVAAMVPRRYPASPRGLTLGMKNSSWNDCDTAFWQIEREQLTRMFGQQVKPRLADGSVTHLSIFGLAPQPLLMLLGSLMTDIPGAEVYQCRREPQQTWAWADEDGSGKAPRGFEYLVFRPKNMSQPPALILSLSATITEDRIAAVLGEGSFSPWVVTIKNPNNDFLRSRKQLSEFRSLMRGLLNEIKIAHGENTMIHVFPAVPVSVAVEMGRVLMPKADLPLRIYDQNKAIGRFVHALDLSFRTAMPEMETTRA